MAWIGRQGDVWDALKKAGAETDDEGRFITQSGGAFSHSSFMGSRDPEQDMVLGDELRYRKDGDWHPVVPLLKDKGLSGIKVI